MSSLTEFRDHCRRMAARATGKPEITNRDADGNVTSHFPGDTSARLWALLADEVDAYLDDPGDDETLWGDS